MPPAATPANLYLVSVYLLSGPTSEKFANKVISRVIEIRGDQTLEQLHHAIFKAYDRWDEHLYEFQLGKRPFDADGPNYGVPNSPPTKKGDGNARTTKLNDLDLKPGRVRRERKKNFMTIFINGKQKSVPRPPSIDGLSIEEFIASSADPIWLHENGL